MSLRFCFSRNHSGISKTEANSSVQKFNVADSMLLPAIL